MGLGTRSEEHTSELQSHSEISYAVFCLKKKKKKLAYTNDSLQASSKIKEFIDRLGSFFHSPCFFDTTFTIIVACCFFFFNDTATTEIYTLSYTLSLHDALPISDGDDARFPGKTRYERR